MDLAVGSSLSGAVARPRERPAWYRRLVLLDPVAIPTRFSADEERALVSQWPSGTPPAMAEQARKRRQV